MVGWCEYRAMARSPRPGTRILGLVRLQHPATFLLTYQGAQLIPRAPRQIAEEEPGLAPGLDTGDPRA